MKIVWITQQKKKKDVVINEDGDLIACGCEANVTAETIGWYCSCCTAWWCQNHLQTEGLLFSGENVDPLKTYLDSDESLMICPLCIIAKKMDFIVIQFGFYVMMLLLFSNFYFDVKW